MRLIDADALKRPIEDRVDHIPSNDYDEGWNAALNTAIDEIDNAPTVEQKEFEQVLQPIKINIPKDITNKLIEEMSKPRKVILDESDPVKDCIIAYGDGFESARRLFERPNGKWEEDWQEDLDFMSRKGWKCPFCKWRTTYGTPNFCMNCGADLRKGDET